MGEGPTLGEEIRAARGERTQTSVAKAAGLTKSYLCDIEKGYRFPPPETLKKIAAVLGVSPAPWLWRWITAQMSEADAASAFEHRTRVQDDEVGRRLREGAAQAGITIWDADIYGR